MKIFKAWAMVSTDYPKDGFYLHYNEGIDYYCIYPTKKDGIKDIGNQTDKKIKRIEIKLI